MNTQYTPSEISQSPYTPLLLGMFGTACLFALLPILQVISNLFVDTPEIENFDTAHDDPPIVFDPPKPEPPKKKKLKKPELDRPLQKIPIEKLPDLFRVGSGAVTYQLGGTTLNSCKRMISVKSSSYEIWIELPKPFSKLRLSILTN